jgi:deoxyribonuclease IV
MLKIKSKILFGVAGFPVNFFSSKYGKNRDNIFQWLAELDLNILELQCTYGIRMREVQARKYKELSEKHNIILTIHAPYYVNLGSLNEETVKNSIEEIKKAFALAKLLGSKRIIFHPGGGYGQNRKEGIDRIITNLNIIKTEIDIEDIFIYPEIGGKVSQLGNLDEIIEICKKVDYAYPCLDLAHLHARENGSLNSKEKIIAILDKVENELGRKYLENAHFHIYPVAYTEGGEKMHKAFGDKKIGQASLFEEEEEEYMPAATNFIDSLKVKKIEPMVICEAFNTQEIGAMLMKDLYLDE